MKTASMFSKQVLTLLLVTTVCFTSSCKQQDATAFDSSYVHEVYFWFHNPNNPEDRTLFETSLKKFLNASLYAKTNFIGTPPKATRDVVDDSFTYNLTLTFESAAAQEAYQNEDAHLVFIKECEHLWEKVIVYDAVVIE